MGTLDIFSLNIYNTYLNIYLRQWKYLFKFNETLHWTAILKFHQFQIKIHLKDIFNETVYLNQINI